MSELPHTRRNDRTVAVDLIDREVRRYQLAQRLTLLQARTQTIQNFTALSRHQLSSLRKRWSVRAQHRHRGPTPHSFTPLFRSPRLRSEALCAAVLCTLLDVVPRKAVALDRRRFYSLETGERMCDAYETFLAYVPDAQLEFDHLPMLVIALAKKHEITLAACTECAAAVLIDLLSVRQPLCYLCSERKGAESSAPIAGD